jgi:hypothetical protein
MLAGRQLSDAGMAVNIATLGAGMERHRSLINGDEPRLKPANVLSLMIDGSGFIACLIFGRCGFVPQLSGIRGITQRG